MCSLICVLLVTLSSIQYSNSGYTSRFPDLPIVYPGPTKETKNETKNNRLKSIFEEEANEVTLSSIKYSNSAYTSRFPDLPIVYPGPTKETKNKRLKSIFKKEADEVTLRSIKYSNSAYTTRFPRLSIDYPGLTKETMNNRLESIFENDADEIPYECRNQAYCTVKPKNYPQEKINNFFSGQVFIPQPVPDIEDELSNREGDPDEKDDCEVIVTFGPIYKVQTSIEAWQTVIQSPKHNFVQKLRLETCKNEGASCFSKFPFPLSFVTSCTQKYTTWELLVIGDDGSPKTSYFELPTCCSCKYITSGFKANGNKLN